MISSHFLCAHLKDLGRDDRWPVKKLPWLVGSCMAGVPDLDSVACTEMTGSAFSSVQKKDVLDISRYI